MHASFLLPISSTLLLQSADEPLSVTNTKLQHFKVKVFDHTIKYGDFSKTVSACKHTEESSAAFMTRWFVFRIINPVAVQNSFPQIPCKYVQELPRAWNSQRPLHCWWLFWPIFFFCRGKELKDFSVFTLLQLEGNTWSNRGLLLSCGEKQEKKRRSSWFS